MFNSSEHIDTSSCMLGEAERQDARSPLDAELDHTAQSVEGTLQAAERLRDRLDPVLREPAPKQDLSGDAPSTPTCEFSERLRCVDDTAHEVSRVLNDIADRLQL